MAKKKKQESATTPNYGESEFALRGKAGYQVKQNPKSGFQVCSLWFWADPEKRSKEWMSREFAGLDRLTIEREYFGERIIYGGKPVYEGAFHADLHVAREALQYDPRFPIIRGWDFAHNHAVVVAQWTGARLRVLAEFANLGYNTRLIAPQVIAECQNMFRGVEHYVEVVDPAGFADGKSSTGVSCVDVLMQECKLTVRKGIIAPPRRIDSVVKLLTTLGPDGKPLMELSPACRLLIDGFKGGYHYPEKATQSQRADRPVKNHPYSDIHDCLQYVASYGRPQGIIPYRVGGDYRFG